MSDLFGNKLLAFVPGTRKMSVHEYKEPFYENTSTALLTTSRENITTVIFSNMATTRDSKTCTGMKTHMAFLKVHKAGSTTMQNLFFRFGLRHNLNILLPRSGTYLDSPGQKLPLRPGEHYDIFACHTVYRTELFKSLLPADSVNIAIVREPVDRMISAAFYFRDLIGVKYLKRIPSTNFIHNLVNFPEKYNTAFFSRTRNTMGKDFGFPKDIQPNKSAQIKAYLDKLNSEFLLVMIMEKFNESLVMMKMALNWSFVDIIYLKSNSHKHRQVVLNATEIAKYKNTSFLDFEIYNYFSQVFKAKLKTMGSDFNNEVKFFENVLDRVHDFCSTDTVKEPTLTFLSPKWDKHFVVRDTDCEWMKTGEMRFISRLRANYTMNSRG
jgi:hypothetical protein